VYRLDPPGLAEDVEVIAREEMYHLWGFAEQVMRLGGKPRLDRATVYADAADVTQMLILGAAGEDGAISKYLGDAEVIDDERIKEYLQRVVRDERQHRLKWTTWLAQRPDAPADMEAAISAAPQTGEGTPPPYVTVSAEALTAAGRDGAPASPMESAILAQYQVVLRALQDYFNAWGTIEAEELLRRSVREMKHLGDLSETYGESGGHVDFPRISPPETEPSVAASVAAEQLAEQTVQRVIDATEASEPGDAVLADVLRRMADDHHYYAQRIKEIPPRQPSGPPSPPGPEPAPDPSRVRRVPDLFGRPQ
jgi:bacterioferritin